MRDLFLEGVPILDALEVSGSTAATARWINCDQSSISRAYRRVSQQLDIAFNKDDGFYQASNNLHLLASLRQASQLRRLAGGVQLLQWVCHPDLPLPAAAAPACKPLTCSWRQEHRSIELLHRRVLDLALVPQTNNQPRPQQGRHGIAAIGLDQHSGITALVLPELGEHPSIGALLQLLNTLG